MIPRFGTLFLSHHPFNTNQHRPFLYLQPHQQNSANSPARVNRLVGGTRCTQCGLIMHLPPQNCYRIAMLTTSADFDVCSALFHDSYNGDLDHVGSTS